MFFSSFVRLKRIRIPNLESSVLKVSVIHDVVSGKDALTRHTEFNEIFNVTLTSYEGGRIKIDYPPLNNFLPQSARFIPASALRHYHHRCFLLHATPRGSQRSKIVPAVNCYYVRVCLLQRGPKRSVKLSPSGVLVCRFRE
jgi:hypothetical protein